MREAADLLCETTGTPLDAGSHIERRHDRGATRQAKSDDSEALRTKKQMEGSVSLQENRKSGGRQGVGTTSSRSGEIGAGSGSGGEVGHRRRPESTVFEMLQAAVRSRHAWLCGEVFREASAMMGTGDGEGLPPSPRELTALLTLLRQFLSLLWVADGQGGRNVTRMLNIGVGLRQ